MLCGSKPGARLSGEFVRVNDLDGVTKTTYMGGNLFNGSPRLGAAQHIIDGHDLVESGVDRLRHPLHPARPPRCFVTG